MELGHSSCFTYQEHVWLCSCMQIDVFKGCFLFRFSLVFFMSEAVRDIFRRSSHWLNQQWLSYKCSFRSLSSCRLMMECINRTTLLLPSTAARCRPARCPCLWRFTKCQTDRRSLYGPDSIPETVLIGPRESWVHASWPGRPRLGCCRGWSRYILATDCTTGRQRAGRERVLLRDKQRQGSDGVFFEGGGAWNEVAWTIN